MLFIAGYSQQTRAARVHLLSALAIYFFFKIVGAQGLKVQQPYSCYCKYRTVTDLFVSPSAVSNRGFNLHKLLSSTAQTSQAEFI